MRAALLSWLATITLAKPQQGPILVGTDTSDAQHMVAVPTNTSFLGRGVNVQCYPLRMCIQVDYSWLLNGVPLDTTVFTANGLDVPSGSLFKKMVNDPGAFPYKELVFAKTFLDFASKDYQILLKCQKRTVC